MVHRSVYVRYNGAYNWYVSQVTPASPTVPSPRQRLLDAAGDLFYRLGINAVGVDLISKEAGVSKRTLYQYFGSKEQLVAESLSVAGASILSQYIPVGMADRSPREAILAAFEGLDGWSASAEFRGCPFINTATELPDPQHPARQVAREFKLQLREYFASQARRGGAPDPQRLADQLIVVFDGAIVQAVMGTAASPGAGRSAAQILIDAQGIG
jgi:AcrR family transcriptional regulator